MLHYHYAVLDKPVVVYVIDILVSNVKAEIKFEFIISVMVKLKLISRYQSSQFPDVFKTYEPRREKTGLRGFRPGLTQTGLYKLRKELEA